MTTTDQHLSDDLELMLEERYGVRRQRRRAWVLGGVAVLVFAAVLLWVAVQLLSTSVEGRVVRWSAPGERVLVVDLELRGEADEVECVIRAKDAEASDVGYAHVRFPSAPSFGQVQVETVVATAQVELLGCASAGDPQTVAPAAFPPGVAPPSATAELVHHQ